MNQTRYIMDRTLTPQVPKYQALKGSSILKSWSLGALWGARVISYFTGEADEVKPECKVEGLY